MVGRKGLLNPVVTVEELECRCGYSSWVLEWCSKFSLCATSVKDRGNALTPRIAAKTVRDARSHEKGKFWRFI